MTTASRVDPFRYGDLKRVVVMVDVLALFTIISALGAVGSYLTMHLSGGMTDDMLDRIDHAMGFDWGRIRRGAEAWPVLLRALEIAYSACFVLPPIIVAVLSLRGEFARLYMFVATHALALCMTVAVSAAFPARAAFTFYHHPSPPDNAVHYGRIIAGLRDGTMRTIDLNSLGGIITFPSFHATMAILFVWAMWPVRRLRAAIIAVNGAMWLSALPVGGHYAIDLIGGSFVALAAITMRGRVWRPKPSTAAAPVCQSFSPA